MRKPDFCISENKSADQPHGNHAADQRLCFRYISCTISSSKIGSFKPLAILCCCTARLVSDLVGNPDDRVSGDAAHSV